MLGLRKIQTPNSINMMGASKRIMEMFLNRRSKIMPVSTARFANVAFSDGSLLYGFNRRIEKNQPIAASNDVRRYIVTQKELVELCLLSCLTGESRDIYFSWLDKELNLVSFSSIAEKYLENLGYESVQCAIKQEARERVTELKARHKYPVYFFASDTTGEKDFEEFYTDKEVLDMDRFQSIGIIKNKHDFDSNKLDEFIRRIDDMKAASHWDRKDLIDIFNNMIPNFNHKETGKFWMVGCRFWPDFGYGDYSMSKMNTAQLSQRIQELEIKNQLLRQRLNEAGFF